MSATEITVGDTVNFTLSIANASDGDTLTIEMRADDKHTVTFENVTVQNGKVSCKHTFSNDGVDRSIKFRVKGTEEYCAEKKLTVKTGVSVIREAYVVSYTDKDAVEKVEGEEFTVVVVCSSSTVCVEMYFGKTHNQTTYVYSTNYTEANGNRTFKMTYTLGADGKSYAGEYPITVQPLSKVDADWKKNVYGEPVTCTLKVTHGSEKDGQCSVCGCALGIESGKDGDNRPEVTYNKQTTLVEKGKIRYVEQYWSGGQSSRYHNEYWTGVDQVKEGKCTRAAASMALSYMGIDLLPNKMGDHAPTGYASDVPDSSCEVRGAQAGGVGQVTTNSSGAECSFTYDDFLEMYNDYASDTEGKYSPIVIHTVYWYANKNSGAKGDKTHAFLVIGRDENDPDYFYVVDSGHSYSSGKVKFTQEGPMRVSEYKVESGASWVDYTNNDGSIRYSKDKILMGVWQYYKD